MSIWFAVYIISCIPGGWLLVATIHEDTMYLLGKREPDRKFGYTWVRWPLNGFALVVLAMLTPAINTLVIVWWVTGYTYQCIKKRMR